MSYHSNGGDKDMMVGAAASGALALHGQVPRLRGGAGYAAWRADMEVYLARIGCEGVHRYALTAEQWAKLVRTTEEWKNESLARALASFGISAGAEAGQDAAGGSTGGSSTGGSAPLQASDAALREQMNKLVERSSRAYGALYTALDADLRAQVTQGGDVPSNFAFGLWKWLERKFQSTEEDSVDLLLDQWNELHQGDGESFDAYRARVNHLDALLKHAGEEQSKRLYIYRLLRKLRPEYRPVVQAIKLSGLLKDPSKVAWDTVSAEINAHERDLARSIGGAVAAAAMVNGGSFLRGNTRAFGDKKHDGGASQWRTAGGSGTSDKRRSSKERKETRTCFRCNERGHISAQCRVELPALPVKQSGAQGAAAQSRGGLEHRVQGERAAAALGSGAASSRFGALDEQEERGDSSPSGGRVERVQVVLVGCERSYAAALQRGIAHGQRTAAPEAPVNVQHVVHAAVKASAPVTSHSEHQQQLSVTESKQQQQQAASRLGVAVPAAVAAVVPAAPVTKIKAQPAVKHVFSVDVQLTQNAWGFDTMASAACSGNRRLFTSLRSCLAVPVKVADGGVVNVSQIGTVELRLRNTHGDIVRIAIGDVLFHEQFASNLLSGELLRQKHGWEYHGESDGSYVVTPGGHRVALSTQSRVAVLLDAGEERAYRALIPGSGKAARVHNDQVDRLVLLHERVGHMGWARLIHLVRENVVVDHGVNVQSLSEADLRLAETRVKQCLGCVRGKATRVPFGHRGLHCGTRSGEVLHMDLYEVKVERDGRAVKEYGLLVVDMFSDAIWHARQLSKDQAASNAIKIVRQAARQFGKPVKRLNCDGGGEFINQVLINRFCEAEGIVMRWTPARTPQLNGAAERNIRTVKEYRCAVMHHAGAASNRFWHYAVDHAVYVWNRTHGSALTDRTPYEVMHGQKASVRHLAVWGCDAWCHIPKVQRGPLDTKAQPCIYLGHDEQQNAAWVLLLETNKVIVSRDVKYRNDCFAHLQALQRGEEALRAMLDAYAEGGEPTPVEWMELDLQAELEAAELQGGQLQQRPATEPEAAAADAASADHDEPEWDVESILARRRKNGRVEYKVRWAGYDSSEDSWEPEENLSSEALQLWQSDENVHASHAPPATATTLRRSARNHASSRALGAASASTAAVAPPERPPAAAAASPSLDTESMGSNVLLMAMCALKGLQLPEEQQSLELVMSALAASIAALEERTPKTFQEAMVSPDAAEWRAALDAEMKACQQQEVWQLVRRDELQRGTNVLPCKEVFKIKPAEDGSIDKFKVRFTPKGFRQKEGVDFFETFARTAMYKTLRLALSLVAKWDHELAQFDVPTAFLYAPVEEDIYMELPEGFRQPGVVCKLLKSLYGLKQAPRNWDRMVHGFITGEMGWKALVSDASFYFKRSRTGRLMLIYRFVDDMQGSYHAEDADEFGESVALLQKRFNIKQLRRESWMLGMRIQRDRKARTITLDQELYVTKALQKFGLAECKVASTPEAVGAADDKDFALERPTDRQRYMEIVGTLMYAAISTRPDIAHAVHYLASHMQAPTHRHALAAERVLRYLAGTKSLGLVFGSRNGDTVGDSRGRGTQVQVDVCAFSDADWANSKRDRKSITGWVAKLNGDPVSWASKKQKTVALSTCEAELYAEAAAIQEVLWLRGLLKELGLNCRSGSEVYGDNQAALAASSNGIKSERTKHVDVKYHFVTETVEGGDVKLKWVPTQQQEADIFTKPLAPTVFMQLRSRIMSH